MHEPGYRGLIIDDDPAIVTELADTIHSVGFACETADCTEVVRQHVAGDPFDFIILDLEIPVRDGGIPQLQHGKNLLRELQGQPATAAVPVIVITGNWQQDPYAGTDVLTLGAAGYVVKPFGIYGRSLDDELAVCSVTGPRRRRRRRCARSAAGCWYSPRRRSRLRA